MPHTLQVSYAMMLIVHCSLSFAALQFVVITRYYASLRLAKNKQQCTLSTIQLRILGLSNGKSGLETITFVGRVIIPLFIKMAVYL